MGLAERRAIKMYQDQVYPLLKLRLDAAAGFSVILEVDWDRISIPGEADRYQEEGYFTDTYFTPVVEAFKRIAIDDMGKQALRKGLLKVVVTCNPGTMVDAKSKDAWPFRDGVLTINDVPGGGRVDLAGKIEAIVRNVEAGI
jgi:hypothetical protein